MTIRSTGCVGPAGIQNPAGPTGNTNPEVIELTEILTDWLKSGDIGNYHISVSTPVRGIIVFYHEKLLERRLASWEINLDNNLIATVWYKNSVLKTWDLHDSESLEEFGRILRIHGANGVDPRHLTRERDLRGANPIRSAAGRSFILGDPSSQY